MKLTFHEISSLANRGQEKYATLSVADEAITARRGKAEEEVKIADSTGFHLYGDLHLTRELSAATEQDKANLFLEVLEDYARIVSDFAQGNPNILIFEIQGERIHLFLNRDELSLDTIGELLDFSSYFTDAVYEIIKPKVEDYWDGFCMATDFGRAIILSTGREGDDPLISLGNPANAPAKRLARTPQVKSGHLAIKAEVAEISDEIRNPTGRFSVGEWIEVKVKDRVVGDGETEGEILLENSIANAKSASAQRTAGRVVALSANAAQIVPTDGATIRNPTFVQAFMIRIDLDGFTARVEAAFAQRNQDAIKLLVLEFLNIMKLPDAFEKYLERPLIRLPWSGDCYNVILLPREYETYETLQSYLPPAISLRWFDLDGVINATRDAKLAAVAKRCNWSIGTSGGADSKGRLLVANLETWHRRFLVAAGWGARYSLDAQNAKGLQKNETAIHDEDYPELKPPFKDTYKKWEGGPTEYRKATAAALQRAEAESLAEKRVHITPRRPEVVVPASRPYAE